MVTFLDLCDELLELVGTLCKYRDTLSLSCCNSRLRRILATNSFWCRKLSHRLGYTLKRNNARVAYRDSLRSGCPHARSRTTGSEVSLNEALRNRRDITVMDECGSDFMAVITLDGHCIRYSKGKETTLATVAGDCLITECESEPIVAIAVPRRVLMVFHDDSRVRINVVGLSGLVSLRVDIATVILSVITRGGAVEVYTLSLNEWKSVRRSNYLSFEGTTGYYSDHTDYFLTQRGMSLITSRNTTGLPGAVTKCIPVGRWLVMMSNRHQVRNRQIELCGRHVKDICERYDHLWSLLHNGKLRTSLIKNNGKMEWTTLAHDVVYVNTRKSSELICYVTEP